MTILPSKYLEQVSKATFAAGVNSYKIALIVEDMKRIRSLGKTVWIVGNGGSAATASHFANDLGKIGEMRAFSLPDMTSVVTAYGNDVNWKFMYAEYLATHIQEHDALFCISCSGRSDNILRAAECAVRNGNPLYVLTGMERDNPLAGMQCRQVICIDTSDITVVEDVHLAICHAIARGIEK